MRVDSEEKTLTGIPAVVVIVGLAAALFVYHVFLGVDPEDDEELQAALFSDVNRYMTINYLLMDTQKIEANHRKTSSLKNSSITDTHMMRTIPLEVISVELDRNIRNTYCGRERQYDVRVQYKTTEQKSVDMIYCLTSRQEWRRSSTLSIPL